MTVGYRTGLAGQLGYSSESSWGVYETAARFQEFLSESIALTKGRVESAGIRSQQAFLAADRWKAGEESVQGDLNFELMNRGMGLFLEHCLGKALPPVASGSGWQHTFVPGDTYGKSLSLDLGRPQIDGTVKSYHYAGMKCSAFSISNAVNGFVDLKMTMDGQTEKIGDALAPASYPSGQELFVFTEGSFVCGGIPYAIDQFTLNGSNGLKVDRYKITTGGKKLEQVINQFRLIDGTFSLDYTDDSIYTDFLNGSTAEFILSYETVTEYDTGKPFKFQITVPCARFDGGGPMVGGPDVLTQSVPWKALDNRTDPIVSFDLFTDDIAP